MLIITVLFTTNELKSQTEINPNCYFVTPDTVRMTPHLDSLYPDWMFEAFVRVFEYKKVSDTRILLQFFSPTLDRALTDSNRYTDDANDSLKHLTGIDDATMSEYSKIYILDSLARMESVYPDSNRILEIVIFEKDTCYWERKCKIGIRDSVTYDGYISGICCSGNDTTQLNEVLGYPILYDPVVKIRYIDYWYKEKCNPFGNAYGCCEIVYRYKKNDEYPAKFVFFEGPIRRVTTSGGGCFNLIAPENSECPNLDTERRRCRRCFENN